MTREELLTTMVVSNPWKRQTKLMLFRLIEYQEMKELNMRPENNSTMTYSMNEKDFLKFTSYRHLVKYMFQLWCAFFHAFTSSMDSSVCSSNLNKLSIMFCWKELYRIYNPCLNLRKTILVLVSLLKESGCIAYKLITYILLFQ